MEERTDEENLIELKCELFRFIGCSGFSQKLRSLSERFLGYPLLGCCLLSVDGRWELSRWNAEFGCFVEDHESVPQENESLWLDDGTSVQNCDNSEDGPGVVESVILRAIKLHKTLLQFHSAFPLRESLTSKESEIVDQIVAFKSNKTIAENLGISPRTVEKHCQNIFQKLEVENRNSLIYKATLAAFENRRTTFVVDDSQLTNTEFARRTIAQLFDSIEDEKMIKQFVVSIGQMTGSKFTNLSIHAPNSDLEGIVTDPDPTMEQLEVIPEINRYIDEQPVLHHLRAHTGEIVYTKISDFLSDDEFRKTNLYQNGYKKMGFDYMMTAGAWDNHGRLYAFNLTRPDRDFTENDRDTLKQVYPWFLKALKIKHLIKVRLNEVQNVLSLTIQQKLILFWIGEGKNNEEISIITGKTTKNVEKHVRNILKAMGLSKRFELLDYRLKQKQVIFPALEADLKG